MDAATVRRRPAANDKPTSKSDSNRSKRDDNYDADEDEAPARGFGVLDVVRVLLGLLILSSAMSWFVHGDSLLWGWKPWFTNVAGVRSWLKGPVYLTDEQLAAFDGSDTTKPIYVGLNGSIYDVSASAKTYGPGGSYAFFAGKDAARGFITGCFDSDLTPDLRGVEDMYIPWDDLDQAASLTKAQLKVRRERDLRQARKRIKEGIDGWAKVFRGETGRPYFWVGTIQREEGWLEKLPKRELCELASTGRPKRSEADTPPKPKPYQ